MLTEQSPTGPATVATDFGHDALGRPVWTEDAHGNRRQTFYDARSNPIRSVDAEEHLTSRTFDSLDRLLTETLPEGIAVERSYDPAGREVSYTDALEQTTTYGRDARGRSTSVTYADSTVESYLYDPAGNLTQVTQPTGSVVHFTYDDAGRRTARTVTPGAGVFGAVDDSYTVDGLDRLTQAVSGPVTVTRDYDSLSRLTEETIAGRTVAYGHDDAGSVTGLTYPSGYPVVRGLDALGRPATITASGTPAATYTYRGRGRVAGKTLGGGALTGTATFDPAGRRLETSLAGLGGARVFGEQISWSPRNLKTAMARLDRNGSGLGVAYDGAGRVTAAAELTDPAATFPNNTTATPAALAGAPDAFAYTHDPAQNLLSLRRTEAGIPEMTATPPDSSGRNRPASVGGAPLTWDANGNLTAKSDLRFAFDDRSRLTRVTDAGGAEIARFEYDAFNRRVNKVTGASTEQTVWAGPQAVEIYRDGQLHQRRTWGRGLDEAVRLETDLDGDGVLDATHLPVYDATGNLVALTDTAGKPVERYEYTPFGTRTIAVDLTPPSVEQVRSFAGELVLEISEEVSAEALDEAVAAGDFAVVETAGGTPLAIEVTQPVDTGRQAGRRLSVTPTDPPPTAGTEVRLEIEPAALTDLFLNQPAAPFELTFPWPAADTILHDSTPPRLGRVVVRDGRLEVNFSEEPDLAAAAAAIQVDGAAVTWTLAADRYTLLADEDLGSGSHQVTVSTAPLDLAGLGLDVAFDETVTLASGTESRLVYEAPDPRVVTASTVGNDLGFHGLEADPDVGWVYARNRWLDPEMGRFVSVDPLGFVDGPNPLAYALNNPINYSDPLGLEVEVTVGNYTFIVPKPLETYAKIRFGHLIGLAAEGHDRYRTLRELRDPGLAMIKTYARRTGVEMERALSIHRRLWRAWEDGGLRGVQREHTAIVDELEAELAREVLALPGVRVGHGFAQAARAESDFERGTLQGRATFRFLEDLALLYGLRAGVARTPAVPRETPSLSTRGFRPPPGTRVVPEGVPEGWRIRPTQGEGGVWYVDPQNPGNAVRVMPGNPNSPYPNSRVPYVRWQRNGQALDAAGNVVPSKSPGAHIPLEDFRFNPDLFQ